MHKIQQQHSFSVIEACEPLPTHTVTFEIEVTVESPVPQVYIPAAADGSKRGGVRPPYCFVHHVYMCV